jgi:FkbM family methyltransferase
MPKESDTVVCIGAGLGHEAIWLANRVSNIRYVGLEIQPYLYELLCNTLKQIENYSAFSLAINNNHERLFLSSSTNYTAVSTNREGYIEVHTTDWNNFLFKNKIAKIDLLQINIEGAEKFLLPMISDYGMIKRIIISAHDFRANRGDGEQFRTREFVKDFLIETGYKVTHCGIKPRQLDWMFAERVD